MMLVFTLILISFPLGGYVLQLFGVGRRRDGELIMSLEIPATALESHIAYFARLHKWSLLHSEIAQDRLFYLFQVGSWGVGLNGSQEVTLTIFYEKGKQPKALVQSKSLMGQVWDFGANQKNLDTLMLFLADLSHDPHSMLARSKVNFPQKHPVVDYRYWALILVLSFVWLGINVYQAVTPKHYIPGRVRVVFQKRVPEDIAQIVLREHGAYRCELTESDEFPLYLCDVPIGEETAVAGALSGAATVREAEAILQND